MMRITHHFTLDGEIADAEQVTASQEEWAGWWASVPDGDRATWSVFRDPAGVFACRLSIPGVVLGRGPMGPSRDRMDDAAAGRGALGD